MNPGIVICEDELIISLDLKIFLERNGYKVTGTFSSAEKAINFIEIYSAILVISNIKLKGNMNGIDLAERMIMNYLIPVLLISGERLSNNKIFLDNMNCHFIEKPFTMEELIMKVSSILSGRK